MSRLHTHVRERTRQSGLTLIELMISLLISSLMIGFVFSIYTRMSVAYRGQSSVSELQQTLQAAKMQVARHVREAGHLIPNGFKLLGDVTERPPVVFQDDPLVANANFNSDVLKVYYADASAMAAVTNAATPSPMTSVTVDSVDAFEPGDVVVIVNPRSLTTVTAGVAALAEYDACVVQLTGVTASTNTLTFDSTLPTYNSATNAHCADALTIDLVARPNKPMIYRFVGRAYRIDPDVAPDRRSTGILQMSRSGAIENDWEDIGLGFTDLQLAARYYEAGDTVDADGDGDATRDWYATGASPLATAELMEVSVSLVARTTQGVNLVPTAQTPDLDGPRLGNSPSITLAGVDDSARPAQYRGDHIYRFTTMRIDLRNLGVGR